MIGFAPPVRDTVFCTVVIPVRPATGHEAEMSDAPRSLYICAKTVPCPDHPQESL